VRADIASRPYFCSTSSNLRSPTLHAPICRHQVTFALTGVRTLCRIGKEFLMHLAPTHDTNGRDANALLKYLPARPHGPGKGPPDIGVMGACRNIKHRIRQVVDKHREHQRDVGKMRPPA